MTAVLERPRSFTTEEAAAARAAFRRAPDDPKRIADEAKRKLQQIKAAQWAADNYGHQNRLDEALLRNLHATMPVVPGFELPQPPRVPESKSKNPPIGIYVVSERRAQEAQRRKQERRRMLLAPIRFVRRKIREDRELREKIATAVRAPYAKA